MKQMRLDRYLAESGCGTRSEVKSLIKKGRVSVNGFAVTDSSFKVNIEADAVMLDGQPIAYEEFRYFMLNKPQGCISATRDGLSETVLDILAEENTRDLFPVGRLDKDTEGLLLITNDGQLAHNMLSPKKHVDKTYIAIVSKALSEKELKRFAEGVDIGDETPTLPAEICELTSEELAGREITAAAPAAAYSVVIREGRFHQIKRMFAAFGSDVLYLKRLSMGSLQLDTDLNPGDYRPLTEEEIQSIKS